MHRKSNSDDLTFAPLTTATWNSFTELFGVRGGCANCWCMYYRLSSAEFREGQKNGRNKNLMKSIVMQGKPAGLLAFSGGRAAAWCAFAPREDFIRLEKSRVHKRIDDKPVWSMPCFFIHKDFRRMGMTAKLLEAAKKYAAHQGIGIIEAYPVVPLKDKIPDAFAWYGFFKTFDRSGFKIAGGKSPNRPLVRYYLDK